jgi:hypothetical protein
MPMNAGRSTSPFAPPVREYGSSGYGAELEGRLAKMINALSQEHQAIGHSKPFAGKHSADFLEGIEFAASRIRQVARDESLQDAVGGTSRWLELDAKSYDRTNKSLAAGIRYSSERVRQFELGN